jgi:uncharacterized protein YjiS (DUF1127 family)
MTIGMILAYVANSYQSARSRRELSRFKDHELAELGVTRASISRWNP